jgi:hypothetical protein
MQNVLLLNLNADAIMPLEITQKKIQLYIWLSEYHPFKNKSVTAFSRLIVSSTKSDYATGSDGGGMGV